jgi:glycerol uptake facilitator-like aquaporin
MFEFTGTFMLSAIWAGSAGVPFDLWIGFFIVLIMGANISGAHFNPCVTAAFMFRRDQGKFKALHGLFYILFQILGALCGMIMAYNLLESFQNVGVIRCKSNPEKPFNEDNWWWTEAIFREFLGSTILVFMYLT